MRLLISQLLLTMIFKEKKKSWFSLNRHSAFLYLYVYIIGVCVCVMTLCTLNQAVKFPEREKGEIFQ